MAKFTINHNEDYSVIANTIFRDNRLSWKAKGLLANMLSLPDNWDYSLAGLVTLATDGLAGTRTGLKELEKFGYLERKAIREKGKIIDWEYLIYETPNHDKPLCDFLQVENLQVEKPQVEKPQVENQTQLNTNQLSIKELSTKIKESTKESLSIFSKDVADSIEKWLQYKKEKRQSYKPTGLKALLNKLEKEARENGDQYVINAIDHSIECNYSGIYPPRTYQQKKDEYCVDREYSADDLKGLFTSIDDLDDLEI